MNTLDDQAKVLEDRLLEGLLDRLNEPALPDSPSIDDESGRLLREYTELLGLIPYELAPSAPGDEVKQRLMAAAAGRGERPATGGGRPAAERSPASGGRRWALPLAAALAIALSGVAGWQFARLAEQRGTIDQLAQQLSAANRQAVRLAEFQQELARAREKLRLVTSRGVEICTLHPMDSEAPEAAARATLFVAADHQHWYLRVDDLEPCPQGRVYQLWFLTDEGAAVDGGVLEVKSGVELEVTSDEMPAGTVAVSITVEPAGGSEQPSGPPVLYGDEVMTIL